MSSDAARGMQQAVRSNNRLLVGGVAAVSAGLGLFWYAQKANQARKETTPHPGAIPTWEYRLTQEQNPTSNPDQHLTQRSSKTDIPTNPKSVPTRSNDDQSGSQGPAASYLNATQGKATDEHQSPKSEPAPQREKEPGSEIASKHREGPEYDRQRHGSDSD
ncbi:hypothetical protein GY45DRAFT_1438041 [Cubamyces sp. BRFM 1775]|nr:hypothetical protein GY45DRAFT_1438041 [Cubamyces sp. BRFM 1775]